MQQNLGARLSPASGVSEHTIHKMFMKRHASVDQPKKLLSKEKPNCIKQP